MIRSTCVNTILLQQYLFSCSLSRASGSLYSLCKRPIYVSHLLPITLPQVKQRTGMIIFIYIFIIFCVLSVLFVNIYTIYILSIRFFFFFGCFAFALRLIYYLLFIIYFVIYYYVVINIIIIYMHVYSKIIIKINNITDHRSGAGDCKLIQCWNFLFCSICLLFVIMFVNKLVYPCMDFES